MFFLFSFIFGFCVVLQQQNIQVYQLCCCELMLRLIWSKASGTSFHSQLLKVLRALSGQTFGTFKKGWFYILCIYENPSRRNPKRLNWTFICFRVDQQNTRGQSRRSVLLTIHHVDLLLSSFLNSNSLSHLENVDVKY